MAEFAALVEFPVAARRDPQTQKGVKKFERDEARPPGDYFAIVNRLARRQRVLEIPGHDDRAIVLDMFGQLGFAPSLDRLAQARYSEAGRERGAKAGLIDEAERTILTGDASRRQAAKGVVATCFEPRGDRAAGILRTNGGGSHARRSHRSR